MGCAADGPDVENAVCRQTQPSKVIPETVEQNRNDRLYWVDFHINTLKYLKLGKYKVTGTLTFRDQRGNLSSYDGNIGLAGLPTSEGLADGCYMYSWGLAGYVVLGNVEGKELVKMEINIDTVEPDYRSTEVVVFEF